MAREGDNAAARVGIARRGDRAARLRGAARLAGPQGRQRSGTGGRGAGESHTELDRRKIRDRIAELQQEIVAMDAERKTQRARRLERQNLASVALVGGRWVCVTEKVAGVQSGAVVWQFGRFWDKFSATWLGFVRVLKSVRWQPVQVLGVVV